MDNIKIKEAAKTIMSMCLDFLQGGITVETFVNNLRTFASYIEEAENL